MDQSDDYEYKEIIHRSARNTVFEKVEKSTGKIVCIKSIFLADTQTIEQFKREVKILEQIQNHPHPNIIHYYKHYYEQNHIHSNNESLYGCIVMERGIKSLATYLNQRRSDEFRDYEVADFVLSMIQAMVHLQRLGIAHRDIKPDNILLFNQENLLFKICDVGFGTFLDSEITKDHTVGGTEYYLSPEMLSLYRNYQHQGSYNPFKSDVYSLGLVFLEFALVAEPIDKKLLIQRSQKSEDFDKYVLDRIRKIKRQYPKLKGISKILRDMLRSEPQERLDFALLLDMIKENEYLEVKSPHKLSHSNWQSLTQLGDLQNFNLEDDEHVVLDLNDMKPQNQVGRLLENMCKKINRAVIKSLVLKAEQNNMTRNSQKERRNWSNWSSTFGGLFMICRAIEGLTTLKRLLLSFSNNILTYDGVNQGLALLTHFDQIENLVLDFSTNQLPVECCESFFFVIQSMPKLKSLELNLEGNHMSLVISKLLQQTIRKLPQLEDLVVNFAHNELKDEGLFQIDEAMKQLLKCQLVLWGCSIKDRGLIEFSHSISNCRRLKEFHFNLWNNQLTSQGVQIFAENLKTITQLKCLYLDFSCNELKDVGVKSLGQAISSLVHLTHLTLKMDNISCTVGCMKYISMILKNLRNLNMLNLNLRANQIAYEATTLLYVDLPQLPQLYDLHLTLDHNPIQQQGVVNIMKAVQKLKYLERLSLNLENVQGTSESVPLFLDGVGNWGYLKEYNVNYAHNDTNEADARSCRKRLQGLQTQAKISINLSEKLENQ